MYVVMTTAELFQYVGFIAGIDSTGASGDEDIFGWDYRDLETESTGISQSELDAYEICIPERIARQKGILAPRGEDWIRRAVEAGERGPIPKAMPPNRPPPEKGKPVQLQLVPIPADQDDSLPWLGSEDCENAPPDEEKCNICRRRVSELEAFGGPGDPLVGDFSGAKLIKQYREQLPDYITSSWECRECAAREGPLWAIHEEDRLGRPLTEREYIDREHEIKVRLLELHEETNQSESKHRVSL